MKKSIFLSILGLGISAIMFYSCKKNTPVTTVDILSTISNYKVTFAPQVTNGTSYSWDFGDGSAASTDMNAVHTYASFGDYTVVLTVTGPGGVGTASKVVSIQATSIKDLLTGGIKATGGKTWVMTTGYTAGQDGGGPVLNNGPITQPSEADVLNAVGLGAENGNQFTFHFDGSYTINLNGNALAGAVYGVGTGTIVGDPVYAVGLCAASYTAPASATWALHTEDFTVSAITDPNTTAVPPVYGNVTFTGQNWLSFSQGAYFGILDFPAITSPGTAKVIINSITSSSMNVSIFLCGYGYGSDPMMMMLPTNLIHMTYVPK